MAAELVEAIQFIQPFLYGGLTLIAFVQWRRRRGRASAWLVASFGVLGFAVVAGHLLPEGSNDPIAEWARKGLVAILVLFPYCLYRFMTSLIRPIRWVWVTAPILTVAVALGALILPEFPEAAEPRPAWFQAYISVLLLQWVFLSGVVAIRLWRAGRSQPTVARRRMQTMSLGTIGLAMALVVAGEASSQRHGVDLVIQLLVLTAGPLLLIGFAPPYFLRASWRRHEEATLNEAGLSLMAATTTEQVARTLLPHARALVGAGGTLLENADGEIVASEGLDKEEARAAVASVEHDSTSPNGATNGSVVRVPMSWGRLTVVASPLTPFFSDDEISRLGGLAALADLALARTRLLETQRRLAAIVESSDDAIVAKSLDGTIEDWNRGAERIYGYRSDEVLGKPISILIPAEIENDIPAILDKVRQGEHLEHYETKRKTKDGRSIDVSLTISPIRDAEGTVTGASTIARDITEHKEMEQEREAAREEAERANQAKNEFLSRMSHELRTPLNAILGFAQLLDMDPLTPEQRDGTTEILKAGKHLLELIDEVLDISRIETGRLRLSLEPVDSTQTVEECISLLTPLANREGVSLSLERRTGSNPHAYVIADRQRLKQVLLNVISNSIKYNRQEGSVRVFLEHKEGDRFKIDVTDTGHGIAAERMERLFAPFDRLGAEQSGIDGVGLGLSLSKALVEAMGGTISVTSRRGHGSTFSVELASANGLTITREDEGSLSEETVTATGTSASCTILYIEDNLSNLKLVERLVSRRPTISLISAMQGGIGITLARDHRPALLLLDLNLPDIPGEEVLARLRSDPRTAELPVVVISADATPGQIKRLLDAGASDYLTKPMDVTRFFGIVDTFCVGPSADSSGNPTDEEPRLSSSGDLRGSVD